MNPWIQMVINMLDHLTNESTLHYILMQVFKVLAIHINTHLSWWYQICPDPFHHAGIQMCISADGQHFEHLHSNIAHCSFVCEVIGHVNYHLYSWVLILLLFAQAFNENLSLNTFIVCGACTVVFPAVLWGSIVGQPTTRQRRKFQTPITLDSFVRFGFR